MSRDVEKAGSPRPASAPKPGVAEIRIIGPADVVDAAVASLADAYPDLWQASTRKPARRGGGDIQYGTLIVPVPKER